MSRSNKPFPYLLIGLAAFACSDEPGAGPTAPAAVLTPAASPQPISTDGRYIMLYNRAILDAGRIASIMADHGGAIESTAPEIGLALATELTANAAQKLRRVPGVLLVEPDILVQVSPRRPDADVFTQPVIGRAADPTQAPGYFLQWHLRQIGADVAWQAGYLGAPGSTIAIVDTGIDYLHPDLVGRVDLDRSVSFTFYEDAYIAANFPGRHTFTDLHVHGTHVAATVASNAALGAGVTAYTTLIAVKVLGFNGAGLISHMLLGVYYASLVGADVINLSVGVTFEKRYAPGLYEVVNQIVTYANSKGSVIIVAAGNDSRDLDHSGPIYDMLCDNPLVMCVSATGAYDAQGSDDDFATYSNYGRSAISVAAPGGDYNAVWAACSMTSIIVPACQSQPALIGLAGTSMATPHVAGLAALLVSELGRNPGAIRTTIQQSAIDLGQVGTDPYYGKGRISVPGALGLN